MNISDLKLLVDAAHAGGETVTATGFLAARDRLIKLGLLIKHPQDDRRVRLTPKGEEFVGLKLSSTPLARKGAPQAAYQSSVPVNQKARRK